MSAPARPISAWQHQGIATLIHALRAAGFPIGASEASDATRLLIDLAAREPGLADPVQLRTRLRPVFCKTREEQERFDAIFDEWARRTVLTWETSSAAARPASPPPLAEPSALARRRRRPMLAAIAIAIAVTAATLAFWSRETAGPSTGPVTETPGQAGGGTTVPPPPTQPGSGDVAAGLDRYVPAARYNRELRTVWFWLLLALPVLPFFGVTLPAMVLARTRLRRSPDPLVLDPRPLELEARRLVPPLSQDVSDRLARHLRSAGLDIDRLARRPVLDVRGTIEATIRNHGIPTLKFSHSRIYPSYLLLIDVASEQDPRGRLFFQWAERLQREKLDVEMLLIRAVDTGESKSVMVAPAGPASRDGAAWTPLARLRAPAFGERLIVISDGDPLVDAAGAWRASAQRGRLYRWHDRVLFTPIEPRDWGVREEAIERSERAADPGFIVLPLEESALSAWTDLVLTGQLSMTELSDPQRFPALLRGDRSGQYLRGEPPPAEQVERLVAQLRIYLGTWGFEWLVACAVPPLVRWELTLLLGQDVLRGLPAATERDVNEALARNYRRLVRLPWLQRETIPQWLRLRLLAELPSGRHRDLQRLVRDRLGALSPRLVPDGIALNFERPPGERAALAPATRDEPTGSRPERRWEGDPLYLGYMSGLTPEQLVLRAPREWAGWARKIRMPRPAGPRGWMARLRDRSTAWWARLAWRDGLPHLGMNRRTGVIASALAVPLGILLVAASQWPLGDDLRFQDGWLFVEKPRVMAWRSGSGRVSSVAFSPDGEAVAVAGEGGLRLLNAVTGAPVGGRMGSALDRMTQVAFSPDGQRLVTGDQNGGVQVWDAGTASPLTRRLPGHVDEITSVTFTPDAKRIVSTSLEGRIRTWDARDGAPIDEPLIGQSAEWSAFAVDPDVTQVVAAARDGSLTTYDGKRAVRLRDASAGVESIVHIAFSPGGRQLVFATADGTLQRMSAGTWEVVGGPMRGHTDWVRSLAFSPDERRIVSAGDDGTVRLWDAQTGAPLGEPLRGHTGVVWSAAFSPDGSRLVSGGDDGVRLWEARVAEPVGEPWRGHEDQITSVAFSPDGTRLVSGSVDGTLRIWNTRTGAQIGAPLQGNGGNVWSVAFSPDGTRVASGTRDSRVRLWDAVTGVPLGEPLAAPEGGVLSVAFSPDGTQLASAGSDDSTIQLWDTRTGQQLRVLSHTDSSYVLSVAFSPDGTQLASSGFDGTIRLWDLRTNALVTPLAGHTDAVTSLAFSPDGTRLASGGEDRTVRVWDARTGAPIGEPLTGHTDRVVTVAYSPGSTLIASSAMDGTLRLWDATAGVPIGSPITSPDGAIETVAFSPDGRYLASGLGGTAASVPAIQQPEQLRQQNLRAPVQQAPPPAVAPDPTPNTIQLWRVDPQPPPELEHTGDQLRVRLASWMAQFERQTLSTGLAVIAVILLIATSRWRRRRAIAREIAAAGTPA